jgi:beta-glucosidase/6-phospho-beta-glucosidase/beta-galactosidase
MYDKKCIGQCNKEYLKEQLNDEFRNEYSLQHIISVIKLMGMGLDMYGACMRGNVRMKL